MTMSQPPSIFLSEAQESGVTRASSLAAQNNLAQHLEIPATPAQTYPRVAVDAVLFTIADRELKTLLIKIKKGPFIERWALPGGLVQVGESLADAARRELYEKTGVQDL